MLCVALTLMSLSCYIFFLEGENCFVAFELTDSIDEELDGNALNLVKPLGWVGMGLFVAACVLIKVYYMATARIMINLKSGVLKRKKRDVAEVVEAHLCHTSVAHIQKAEEEAKTQSTDKEERPVGLIRNLRTVV
jgi:hypothetical protein